MTSDEIKDLLIDRFTFSNGYVGAVYEAANLNAADVVAVKHGGKVQEFEIKVSRSDLVGEMRCARVAAGLEPEDAYLREGYTPPHSSLPVSDYMERKYNTQKYKLSSTKLWKHQLYLTDKGRNPVSPYASFPARKPFVPNTFYWCIPYSLLEVCQQLNMGLPYGIYVFDMPQKDKWAQKFIVKPARSLNGQGDRLYFELFNRACTLWSDERNRIAYLKKQLPKVTNV